MAMDFTGFEFCHIKSEDLGILRVSNGSRYEELLSPSFQDTTAQIPGREGLLYWDTFNQTRSWTIDIAFDSVTETQMREMRQLFNGKMIGPLIFNELPFKVYTAKLSAPAQLKYLCFGEEERIYKGEGILQFISFLPYARSLYRYLEDYSPIFFPNKEEWAAASGLRENIHEDGKDDLDTFMDSGKKVRLYNGGDLETDFALLIKIADIGATKLEIRLDNEIMLKFGDIEVKDGDTYIQINSKTNLVEGLDIDKKPTPNLYNNALRAGSFFKLPLGESILTSNVKMESIDYHFLYY